MLKSTDINGHLFKPKFTQWFNIDQTMMKREWMNTFLKIYYVYNCQLNKPQKDTIPVKGDSSGYQII